MVAGGVELEGVAGDQQEGGICCAVTDGLAEVVEGVAQVAERSPVGPIGPQQAGQYLAAVHAVRFHGQVGQQRPDLGGFKARDRFPVQCDPEKPQQEKRKVGHRSCPREVSTTQSPRGKVLSSGQASPRSRSHAYFERL